MKKHNAPGTMAEGAGGKIGGTDFLPETFETVNAAPPAKCCARQRQLLGQCLINNRTITTLEARDELAIMSPAARVMELRKLGWRIVMSMEWMTDRDGRRTRCGRYVLVALPGEAVAA